MKILLSILFLLLSCCLIAESAGIARHSRSSTWCERVCHSACSLACPKCPKECSTVCHDVCHRKRSGVFGSHLLPCGFSAWDNNGDGHVDFEEFFSVAYPFIKKGHLSLLFQSIDTDGNQRLSEREMQEAPFLFKSC